MCMCACVCVCLYVCVFMCVCLPTPHVVFRLWTLLGAICVSTATKKDEQERGMGRDTAGVFLDRKSVV